jgi:16S rRNA (cytidine1402-2'-O)-methyltransferase
MARRQSQQTSRKPIGSPPRPHTGTLFIVGTPIGSPDDLSIRARTLLGQISIVAAETPLATQALLAHHGISTPITSYGRGEDEKVAVLLDRLKAGHDVALVSDCGMPVIYDPGRLLIEAAQAAGCPVTVVPGPSALTAAAALSGYPADRLVFVGRLPKTASRLDKFFSTLERESGTTIMFVPRPALGRILHSIERILPGRAITLAVNMTKPDERWCQGSATSLLQIVRSLPREAEVTLALAGVRRGSRTI